MLHCAVAVWAGAARAVVVDMRVLKRGVPPLPVRRAAKPARISRRKAAALALTACAAAVWLVWLSTWHTAVFQLDRDVRARDGGGGSLRVGARASTREGARAVAVPLALHPDAGGGHSVATPSAPAVQEAQQPPVHAHLLGAPESAATVHTREVGPCLRFTCPPVPSGVNPSPRPRTGTAGDDACDPRATAGVSGGAAFGDRPLERSQGEIHLFIFWEPDLTGLDDGDARARRQAAHGHYKDALSRLPQVVDVFRHPGATVADNEAAGHASVRVRALRRFYGSSLLQSGFDPATHTFTGDTRMKAPFTVLVVYDAAPRYEVKNTTHGTAYVNSNMFNVKRHFRDEDVHVHATDNTRETACNMDVLGMDYAWYAHELPVPPAAYDVSHGLSSLFDRLDAACADEFQWVVARNWEGMPGEATLAGHTDVDLIVSDYRRATLLLGAVPEVPVPTMEGSGGHRVHTFVRLDLNSPNDPDAKHGGDTRLLLDLRHVGDGYYDKEWEIQMLRTRKRMRGFYVPAPPLDVFAVLYHAVIHKRLVKADYPPRIYALATAALKEYEQPVTPHSRQGASAEAVSDVEAKHLQLLVDAGPESLPPKSAVFTLLYDFLEHRGWAYARPDDTSVGFFLPGGVPRAHPR